MTQGPQSQPYDDDEAGETGEPSRRSSVRKQLQELLRIEDALSVAGSLGLLLGGIAFCVGAGIVFATIIVIFLNVIADSSYIGWFGWFLVYWVAMVPLLIWQDRKAKVGYVVGDIGGAGGRSELDKLKVRTGVAVWAEMLLWGPRSLVEGLAGFRHRWTARQNWVFNRASRLTLDLAKHEGGVRVKDVMRPPEDMPIFLAAVTWLDKNNWIGQSSEGDKLWLSSIGRKKLLERKWLPDSNFRVVER